MILELTLRTARVIAGNMLQLQIQGKQVLHAEPCYERMHLTKYVCL